VSYEFNIREMHRGRKILQLATLWAISGHD
jgi:hypothetical protein